MKISIIIPTRERADYLPFAIRTALEIDDDDIEIVVCDNFSQDHTGEVLSEITDPRVRCINTGARISMRENFNHALMASTGSYVLFFGDDDGIVPGQFRYLRHLLERHRPDGMSWARATYGWPVGGYGKKTGGLRFYRHSTFGGCIQYDPKERNLGALRRCELSAIAPVTPNVYHGCVSRGFLERLAPAPGVFFDSAIPDVNFEYRTTLTGGAFLHADHPFTISGHSPVSTGGAHHGGRTDAEGGNAGRAFTAENKADPLEDAFDHALTIPLAFFATLETVIARMGHTACRPDLARWYRYGLSAEPGNPEATARIDAILHKYAEQTGTTEEFAAAKLMPPKPKRSARERIMRLRNQIHSFRVLAAKDGENTILTAAQVCDGILGDEFGAVIEGQMTRGAAWSAARHRSKAYHRQL
ncbi:glycosyltransferase family 2 protein [Pseudohalocynthiibacter aestuariivivens]|nr:glycosyltransferase family 2 protein [Pseudohalocynthiibacter aestuariivivens]QIE45263.1 glycosyltransferase family 2 protein [Pseudohalocynthiibacter aestuariivivens]